MFMLSERYKLELHWNGLNYDKDGVCLFTGAYFSGPAINNALPLQANDHIMLDFYRQYFVLVPKPYIGKFSWGEVIYKENKIFLRDSKLENTDLLNKVPKLNSNDYLVIDTENHEEAIHSFNFLYKTYVIKETGDEYNFRNQ